MTSRGPSAEQSGTDPVRVVQVAGSLLLALDVGMTALLYERLPQVIAVHWTTGGVANGDGDRGMAWLLPMILAFMVGLGLVGRRHTRPADEPVLAVALALGSLYMFSASLLLLLANVDNRTWQQGGVGGKWIGLAMALPALVVAAGVYAHKTLRRRG